MGKSEILMLLAGVALSVMLAMIAIPMFSSGQDMTDKQQVQQELLAIKSAIPLIKALEGSEYEGTGENAKGKITAANIISHMKGFKPGEAATDVKGDIDKPLANFTIKDNDDTGKIVTVIVKSLATNVKLNELSRLSSICDGTPTHSVTSDALTCNMKR